MFSKYNVERVGLAGIWSKYGTFKPDDGARKKSGDQSYHNSSQIVVVTLQ